MKSANTPGQVGAEGTNPKKRGWSTRAEYRRICVAACSSTSAAGRPSSGGGASSWRSSSRRKSPSQASSLGRRSLRCTIHSAALRARSSISSGPTWSPFGITRSLRGSHAVEGHLRNLSVRARTVNRRSKNDPLSASKIDPLIRRVGGCPGSQQEGPARLRVALCVTRSGAARGYLLAHRVKGCGDVVL